MMAEPRDPSELTLAEVLETDLLRCPQCRQPFTSPTLLPCLHAFCSPCLQALPHTPVTNGNNNNTKMMTLTCPLCRSTVTTPETLTPDPFLQSLCDLRAFKQTALRVCSYCRFDGKEAAADFLCLDCADDMCEPCATAHRKTRLTRDHTIAPYTQIRNGLYDHDIRARHALRCHRHDIEVTDLCCDCLTLTCPSCQADAHRGHALEPMEAARARFEPEALSFVKGLRKRGPALTEYQHLLQGQQEKLEERKRELVERVRQQAEDIHRMVDQHRDSVIAQTEAAFSREREEMGMRVKDLELAKMSLDSNARYLAHLLSLGNGGEVLSRHPAIMARLKQLLHMQTHTMTHKLSASFLPGLASPQNVAIMLGKLDVARVPVDHDDDSAPRERLSISSLLPEPLDPPTLVGSLQAKLGSEVKEVWPSGLKVRKEKLAVVDRDNRKVKVFDCSVSPPTLKFQFSGKGEHQLQNPFDCVLLENGVVVVTDHGAEKVKMFDITGRWIGDLGGEFRHPRGIAVTSQGHLVVVDGLLLRLTVHDPESGKVLYTIPPKDSSSATTDSPPSLVDPFYVAVTEQDHFVVTDHAAPNVRVFSKDGTCLATYGTYGTCDSEVLKPYGVCIDRYGQMLIADSDNHRVHLLLPDGSFNRLLLTHHHKVSHPVTVAIDTNGCLLVGEAFGTIKTFKYL